MKNVIFLTVAALALAAPAFGKIFERCSLARELNRLGVPKNELAIWTCLAERESSYRTNAVSPTNSNGSKDYGIFQINSKYWCKPSDGSSSHNGCKINCNSLLTDDIKPQLTCALLVKKQQGWTAWSTWKYCKGQLKSIDPCF